MDEDEDSPLAPAPEADTSEPPPLTLILTDPSGTSFIEFASGSNAGADDPQWDMKTYKRTRADNVFLALVGDDDDEEAGGLSAITEEGFEGGEAQAQVKAEAEITEIKDDADEAEGDTDEPPTTGQEVHPDEILTFPGICSSCGHDVETHMKRVDIPYFQACILTFLTFYRSLTAPLLANNPHLPHMLTLRLPRQ